MTTRPFRLILTTHSLILDGEMLVFDPDTGSYLPFGNLKGAALGDIFCC